MSHKENPQPEGSSRERLTNLLNDRSLSRGQQSLIPKIQKVQPYLRGRKEFAKYYSPKLLSIGPIHHGNVNLKLGEQFKLKWTKAYLEDAQLHTEAAAQQLHESIRRKIQDLKKLYMEDAIKEYMGMDKDEDLIWMLFVDGCSILHIINNAGDNWGIEAAKKLEIKIDQLLIVLQDMLLLENQLPYELLTMLTGNRYRYYLDDSMFKFLQNHNMLDKPPPKSNNKNPPTPESSNTNTIHIESHPTHLLDLLLKMLQNTTPSSPPKRQQSLANLLDSLLKTSPDSHSGSLTRSYRIRNIQELKAAGIAVKKRSQKKSLEEDVKFTSGWLSGVLELPEIIVDDFTAPTLMNLIAYEMCPEVPSNFEISSYVAFLDLLIDHPDDVKELRSAGVLQNQLGNDEEVAKLFNTISTDLIADMTKYARVRNQIEEHCNHLRNTWIAEVLSEHFSSPWTIVAFLTAVIVTGLTVVQTWFAINPPK